MSSCDIKKLEKQRETLDKKIQKYYLEEEEKRIRENEEKYVGHCYKIVEDKSTIYFKFISGLTNNTYCYMHRMLFKLPVDPGFRRVLKKCGDSKFEYDFYGDLLEFGDTMIDPLGFIKQPERIEITLEEFEDALKEFGNQLLEVSRENFTIDGEYFKK